ncbi:MAG: hypothetical protein O7H40_03445 [Gammaproteobacteria bacterium]|nr:hypothetical protein [Gammaproteobacteria bacterium]
MQAVRVAAVFSIDTAQFHLTSLSKPFLPAISIPALLLLAWPWHFEANTETQSRFANLRELVFRQPYARLPNFPVDVDSFGPSGERPDNALRAAARRILAKEADLHDYPQGRKLLQANGICFSGEWIIEQASPYTGFFAAGTHEKAIVRGSVLFGKTTARHRRTFGLAIKLFPASDFESPVRTVNLFVMEAFGGAKRSHIVDARLDNDPELGRLPAFGTIRAALRLRRDLGVADEEAGSGGANLTFRPISHAAEAGLDPGTAAASPHWMRLIIEPETPRIDFDDFREELRVEHYPGAELVYRIDLADFGEGEKKSARWQTLGRLRLYESITSRACDARLHFPHPRLR